jgi:hypothetical protein
LLFQNEKEAGILFTCIKKVAGTIIAQATQTMVDREFSIRDP